MALKKTELKKVLYEKALISIYFLFTVVVVILTVLALFLFSFKVFLFGKYRVIIQAN